MKEFFSCLSLPDLAPCPIPKETILCLGNFDGVHLGHRSLLDAAKGLQRAASKKLPCGVFCFHGLSSDFLCKDPPKHLDSEEKRLEKFAECGMDFVIFADFARICDLSPADFIGSVLLDICHAKSVVCGENYRFGKGGQGTPDLLSKTRDLSVKVLPELVIDGFTVSSTRIRRLLEEDGNAKEAARLMSCPYTLTARVEHGKGLGHKLGVPTINQSFPPLALIPKHGVYFTQARVGKTCYPAISNVGLRPSVEETDAVNCETNLFSFSGSLYEETVTIEFLDWLRAEQTFSSEEELQCAIQNDIALAKDYFAKKQ